MFTVNEFINVLAVPRGLSPVNLKKKVLKYYIAHNLYLEIDYPHTKLYFLFEPVFSEIRVFKVQFHFVYLL